MVKDFLNGFLHFSSKRQNKVLILIVSFSTIGICLFYFFFQGIYQKSLVEQMQHRQQMAGRSGARSIETFLALMGAQVVHYAENQDLDGFLENLSDFPIGGIIFLDKNGVIIDNASRFEIDAKGQNLSQRNYFLSLKEDPSQKFVISESITSKAGYSEGKNIIIIASPVLKNGEFSGVLASSIVLVDLNQDFFDSIKVTENTIIGLVDESGNVVSSTGELALDTGSPEIVNTIKNRKESKFEVETSKSFLVSTAPVEYQYDKTWALIVMTPVKDSFVFTMPFENYSMAFLIYVIVMIIGFGTFLVMVSGIAKRDGYLKGFINGKKSAQTK